MTDTTALAEQLRLWLLEAKGIEVPEAKLPMFLATRLVDSKLVTTEDQKKIVRAVIGNRVRTVRVIGWDPQRQMLSYEMAEGYATGNGLLRVDAIIAEDNPKLAEIIGALPQPHRRIAPREWRDGGALKLTDLQGGQGNV